MKSKPQLIEVFQPLFAIPDLKAAQGGQTPMVMLDSERLGNLRVSVEEGELRWGYRYRGRRDGGSFPDEQLSLTFHERGLGDLWATQLLAVEFEALLCSTLTPQLAMLNLWPAKGEFAEGLDRRSYWEASERLECEFTVRFTSDSCELLA